MVGTKNSGRRPKPLAVHVEEGTYRAHRHADLADAPEVGGTPVRPKGLSSDAAWLWRLITSEYRKAGVLKKIDTPTLWGACELWALYRKAAAAAAADPLDKDARIGVTAYWSKFSEAAARLGLNPADRQALRVDKGKSEPNELFELFAQYGA